MSGRESGFLYTSPMQCRWCGRLRRGPGDEFTFRYEIPAVLVANGKPKMLDTTLPDNDPTPWQCGNCAIADPSLRSPL